jgi:hypothetical protein
MGQHRGGKIPNAAWLAGLFESIQLEEWVAWPKNEIRETKND